MAKTALIDLDKLQRLDHDTLIGLRVTVDTFITQYNNDMKELKDGYTATLTGHEGRIRNLEHLAEIVKPEEAVTNLSTLMDDYHSRQRDALKSEDGKRNLITLVSAISAIIGGIVATLLQLLIQRMGIK